MRAGVSQDARGAVALRDPSFARTMATAVMTAAVDRAPTSIVRVDSCTAAAERFSFLAG